jgi:hypothetical protein
MVYWRGSATETAALTAMALCATRNLQRHGGGYVIGNMSDPHYRIGLGVMLRNHAMDIWLVGFARKSAHNVP